MPMLMVLSSNSLKMRNLSTPNAVFNVFGQHLASFIVSVFYLLNYVHTNVFYCFGGSCEQNLLPNSFLSKFVADIYQSYYFVYILYIPCYIAAVISSKDLLVESYGFLSVESYHLQRKIN